MRLEPAEFDLLWRRLELPQKPLELNVPAAGPPPEPPQRADGLLRVVGHRTAQVDLRWAGGAGELRGLVAVRGRHRALALWDGEGVTLRWVDHVEDLVAALEEMPQGEGRSISVPTEAVTKAAGTGDVGRVQQRLVTAGVPRPDARTFAEFLSARRLRAGQIGASAADRWGTLRRAPRVIHVLDTDRGRYATYERGGYRMVVGVDRSRLATIVRELYTEVAGA